MVDLEKLDRDFERLEQLTTEVNTVLDEMQANLDADEPPAAETQSAKTSMRTDAKFRITDEVAVVLKQSRIEGNNLYLPDLFDNRPLYNDVMKVIAGAGGRWNRKAGAHVFESDPREKLRLVVDTGVAVNEKKALQAFYTPQVLADSIALLADVKGQTVLEPSAGRGALADSCMRRGAAAVRCIEINDESAAILREKGYETVNADFLTLKPKASDYVYRVVMNPPFTRNQDIQHVRHALSWLRYGGSLTAIMFGNRDRKGFRDLVETHSAEVREVPRGAFKESGTDIPTVVVKIEMKEKR